MQRLASAAQHAGRRHDSFTFEMSGCRAEGDPMRALVHCTGVMLRVWRHGKFYDSEVASLLDGGCAQWEGALKVPCTLYHSKGGKTYSSKCFRECIRVATYSFCFDTRA